MHRHLSSFDVGVGVAAALDTYQQSQINQVFEAAEAAQLWYRQTGQMTDVGSQAIAHANYLSSHGKRHQSVLAGPGNAVFGLGLLVAGFFGFFLVAVGIGWLGGQLGWWVLS